MNRPHWPTIALLFAALAFVGPATVAYLEFLVNTTLPWVEDQNVLVGSFVALWAVAFGIVLTTATALLVWAMMTTNVEDYKRRVREAQEREKLRQYLDCNTDPEEFK